MQVRFVVLGDTHFPFHCKRSLSQALEMIKEFRPKYVIQIGDLFDLWSVSRYSRAQNSIGMTALQEFEEARATSEEMWGIIQKYSPSAKCIQLAGNHDIRFKTAIVNGLPELFGSSMVDIEKPFKFKGVKTYFDDRQEVVIEGVCFMHGFYTQLGKHCRYNLMPTVLGHTHRGGVFHATIQGEKRLWELNAGYLGAEHTVFSYTRQKWKTWTRGVGLIWEHKRELHPQFVQFGGSAK